MIVSRVLTSPFPHARQIRAISLLRIAVAWRVLLSPIAARPAAVLALQPPLVGRLPVQNLTFAAAANRHARTAL